MLSLILSILRSPSDDDGNLLARVADGDERALRTLYDRYAGKVLATARRLLGGESDADEVVQETFIDVWHRADRFDRARGSAASWIVGIGRNRAIDRLRARTTRDRTISLFADEAPSPTREPEGEVVRAESARLVAKALDVLAPELRTVVELAYYHGLSQSEIAERTGHPLGTIKGRARTALKQLADHLFEERAKELA